MALHRRFTLLTLLCCLSWLMAGCDDDTNPAPGTEETVSQVTGAAQKGPFQPGGTIAATALADGPTEQNHSSTLSESGNYAMEGLSWEGPTKLEVSGTFYNEYAGNYTAWPETLTALIQLPEESRANINLFTHLVAARAQTLIANGTDFAAARNQARTELAGITGTDTNPLTLDLLHADANRNEDDAANLLLFSTALMATADPARVLDNITQDFADNGRVDGQGLAGLGDIRGAALSDSSLLTRARINLQNQYSTTPPNDTDGQPPGWLTASDTTAPSAAFTTSGPLREGQPQAFDAHGSVGDGLDYAWSFGDGNSATGVATTHIFLSAGSYPVTLTVTDSKGRSENITRMLVIGAVDEPPPPPQAAFDSTGTATAGTVVNFDASTSLGASLLYGWDFGDGTTGNGVQTDHVFTEAGSYTVVLTVTDPAGQSASVSHVIEVVPAIILPEAAFSSSGNEQAGQPQTFDASTSSGETLTWHWDFGDGDAGTGMRIAHLYDNDGDYTVTLTVTDSNGNSNSAHQTLHINPRPATDQPEALDGIIAGTVLDATETPLAGVDVTLITPQLAGTRNATTNAQGKAELVDMPTGVEFVLELSKAGYAAQLVRINIPPGTTDATFKASLMKRAAAQTWPAIENGGTQTGSDGIAITLPPNALVDENGDSVTGSVSVSLTPVDVSADDEINAFPGSFVAYDDGGERGLMLSYGVAEFHITQGGEPLQIAPGKQATLRIPVYITKNKDGTPVTAGQTLPLWSLDETTGQWIQEGTGVVVNDSTSPTGLAFEAKVGHLSWYNCDDFVARTYRPVPHCIISSSSGLPTLELTETCAIQGRIVGDGPQTTVTANIPASGGVPLPIPADVDYLLTGIARNGTLKGEVTVHGVANTQDTVDIVLYPVDNSSTDQVSITLPYQETNAIDAAGEVDRYRFSGSAGQYLYLEARHGDASNLWGSISVLDADGQPLNGADHTSSFNWQPGILLVKLPADGDYQITVSGTDNMPGSYDLSVSEIPAIRIGQNIEGTMPPDGVLRFAFDGTAGTVISAINIPPASRGNPVSTTLLSAQGEDLIGYRQSAAQLPADGPYLLELSGHDKYRTAVARLEAPQALSFDGAGRAETSGDLKVYGDRQYYLFTAEPGTGVYVTADAEDGSSLLGDDNVEITVYSTAAGSTGNDLSIDNAAIKGSSPSYSSAPNHLAHLGLTLPDNETTTYLVSVRSYSGADGLGQYRLRLDTAAPGDTVTVDDDLAQCADADTRSVHAAAHAVTTGGTVDVCAGHYAEDGPVSASDGIHIVGRDRAAVILSTTQTGGTVIGTYFGDATISLKNLTIAGKGGPGIIATVGTLTDVTFDSGEAAGEATDLNPYAGYGNLKIDKDGAVIDGLVYTGDQIIIKGKNAKVRNSTFTTYGGGVSFGSIHSYSGHIVFENNTVNATNGGVSIASNGSVALLNNTITTKGEREEGLYDGDVSIRVSVQGSDDAETLIRGNTLVATDQGGMSIHIAEESPPTGQLVKIIAEQNSITLIDSTSGRALEISSSLRYADTLGTLLIRNNLFDGWSARRGSAIQISQANRFNTIDIINNSWRSALPGSEEGCLYDCGVIYIGTDYAYESGALPVRLINNIIVGWALQDEETLYVVQMEDGATIDAQDNLFSNVDGFQLGSSTGTGTGNFKTTPPVFINDRLEVGGTSYAVDAGQGPTAGGPPIPDKDYDGTPRPQHGSYDIGAHEWMP